MPADTQIDILRARILQRRLIREAVKDLLDLVEQVTKPYKTVTEDEFYDELSIEAAARIGKRVISDGPSVAMNTFEAAAFEATTVPYGIHKGKKVRDVEPSYLLAITEGDFSKDLRRYVLSSVFKDRQR